MITRRGEGDSTDNNKVVKAMERIEALYQDTKGKCYVSFSGGKDSTVILALIKMCEEIYTITPNSIPAVFVNTGLELGATIEFVQWVKSNYYPNVETIRPNPKKPFDWIIKTYGKPIKSKLKSENIGKMQRNDNPFYLKQLLGDNTGKFKSTMISNKDMHLLHPEFDIRIANRCCDILKKNPVKHFDKQRQMRGGIIGERSAEGGARLTSMQNRVSKGGSACTRYRNGVTIKTPLIDWTDKDVDEFIEKYNVPLSKAYTEQGYERTGCFLCPFSLQVENNLTKLHQYEPLRYKAAMYWLKDVYIAQNVSLPFDEVYEKERLKKWNDKYFDMRCEMILKYRPKSRKYLQKSLF